MTWTRALLILLTGLLILAAGATTFIIREGERITITTPPNSTHSLPADNSPEAPPTPHS